MENRKNSMIAIDPELKRDFEIERMKVIGEMMVPVNQGEFIKILLDSWRKRK